MHRKTHCIYFIMAVIITSPLPTLAGMVSNSYYIPASIFSGGGGSVTSDMYQADSSLGQPLTCMTQESENYALSSGFWHTIEVEPVLDYDNDGIPNSEDNCPDAYNQEQEDSFPPQGNGMGDACECEGNFNCSADQDVDGTDAFTFKADFGRSIILHPCNGGDPCSGDFACDSDVDGTDAFLFKTDFGRSTILNPCPWCEAGVEWCNY